MSPLVTASARYIRIGILFMNQISFPRFQVKIVHFKIQLKISELCF